MNSVQANAPLAPVRIAVLICCHNRKEKTLACLTQLSRQQGAFQLQIYLVDDASTDGTAAAVAAQFPQVRLLHGDGQLFWNGGMRKAWLQALADSSTTTAFDFYLWLNDDVALAPGAIADLLRCYQQLPQLPPVGALIGSMAEPAANIANKVAKANPVQISYGGRNSVNVWHPLKMGPLLQAAAAAQRCDFINGNLCLVPAAAVQAVGILSDAYTHSLADYDYGLRLKQHGFALYVAPGVFGQCASNSLAGGVFDRAVPFRTRLGWLQRPNKFVAAKEWQYFVRQHGGLVWPLLWASTLLRRVLPALWLLLRQRQLSAADAAQHTPQNVAEPRPLSSELPLTQPQTEGTADPAEESVAAGPASAMSAPKPLQVVIVQQVLKQYRLPLFLLLHQQLQQQARPVQLKVMFSLPNTTELSKQDNVLTAPAHFYQQVPVQQFGPLVWQQCGALTNVDLIIVEQANRHLLNWWLLLRTKILRWVRPSAKLQWAVWGHGFNHQQQRDQQGNITGLAQLKQRLKAVQLNASAWFFAYTRSVADFVASKGIASTRITVLNNSIDTRLFSQQVAQQRAQLTAAHIAQPVQTGLKLVFCGALYQDKQLPLLLAVADRLAAQQLLAELVVIGAGPLSAWLVAQAEHRPWLRCVGSCFGEQKAFYFATADLFLNPGLTGLAILDAFAAGLPFVTTDYVGHSPEIAYLKHQYNGLLLPMDANIIADALQKLAEQPAALAALQQGAKQSATEYSIEAMAQQFCQGIVQLLNKSEP